MKTKKNNKNKMKGGGMFNWLTGQKSQSIAADNNKNRVAVNAAPAQEEAVAVKAENVAPVAVAVKAENEVEDEAEDAESVDAAKVLTEEVRTFEKGTNNDSSAALASSQALALAGNMAVATAAGQAVIAGLAATGVGIPLAGLLGIILLLANKLALLFYYNLQLHSTLLDLLNIVSNCFRLNDLINYTTNIFTIYFFGRQDDKNLIENLDTLTIDTYTSLLNKALENKKAQHSSLTVDKNSESIEEIGVEMTTITNANANAIVNAKVVNSDQQPDKLIKWISPNVAIQQRLFDKLNDLTDLLLQIATNDMVRTLKNDPTIMNSGMGNLINKVYTDRKLGITGDAVASMTRKFGRFSRGFNRAANGQFLQQQLINELTLVNGFFMLMKAQYDMTIDYYERSMDSDQWKEIWTKYIQNSSVYIEYLVPSDISEKIKEGRLNISKAAIELASTNAIEVINTNDKNKTKIDDDDSTNKIGGKRYRLKSKKIKRVRKR